MDTLTRTLAYLEKLPHAVNGSNGHDATWAAVLACRRFGLGPGEMWEALQWWNDNRCDPPWSEKELRHKLMSAEKIAVSKPMAAGGFAHPTHKPVAADALRERMAQRRAARPAPPVWLRSEAEEEDWWAQVFAERGLADPAPKMPAGAP